VCFIVRKAISKQECAILTTLYLSGAKNIDSWHTRKEDLQRAFPLDVLMVPSSALTVTTDGEHLTCSGFSLGETIHLRNFEFITNYFGGPSLSSGGPTKAPLSSAQFAAGHLHVEGHD
jgi:hypothetical protein